MEIFAAREACANITDEDLTHLGSIIHEQEVISEEGELAELIKKDWEFHKSLYDICDNEALKKVIHDLWSQMRQAQGLVQVNAKWGEKWVRQSAAFHGLLLEALRERDADKVEELLTAGFDFRQERLIEVLQELRWVDSNCNGRL